MRYGSLTEAYVSLGKYAGNTRLPFWRRTVRARGSDGSVIRVDGFDSVGILKLGKDEGNVPYAEIDARPIKHMTDSALEIALARALGNHFEYNKKDGFFKKRATDEIVASTTWPSESKTAYRFLLFDQSGALVVNRLVEGISSA